MSKSYTGSGDAIVGGIHDSLCRSIRIAGERIRLARELEIVARSRDDVLSVLPRGWRTSNPTGSSPTTAWRTQQSGAPKEL